MHYRKYYLQNYPKLRIGLKELRPRVIQRLKKKDTIDSRNGTLSPFFKKSNKALSKYLNKLRVKFEINK